MRCEKNNSINNNRSYKLLFCLISIILNIYLSSCTNDTLFNTRLDDLPDYIKNKLPTIMAGIDEYKNKINNIIELEEAFKNIIEPSNTIWIDVKKAQKIHNILKQIHNQDDVIRLYRKNFGDYLELSSSMLIINDFSDSKIEEWRNLFFIDIINYIWKSKIQDSNLLSGRIWGLSNNAFIDIYYTSYVIFYSVIELYHDLIDEDSKHTQNQYLILNKILKEIYHDFKLDK
jgi:hypothetical protein